MTLDSLPVQPRAGETISLGFMVRQHGLTPISDSLNPYLSAQNLETGDSLRVDARQEGPVGHFVLNVVFPSAGTWDWKIAPEPFPWLRDPRAVRPDTRMPNLELSDAEIEALIAFLTVGTDD